jgi:hypothetical protein
MFSIRQEEAPENSLLKTFRGGRSPERWGGYGDCFSVTVGRSVSLADFVYAFYTSSAFRIEALLLRAIVGAASNARAARAVADGTSDTFAAWYVGERTDTQLLMCDRYERTRSWFSVEPMGVVTWLRFGSALAAARHPRTEPTPEGGKPGLLMRFHILYSQVLLQAAKSALLKPGNR